ncbi:MAG: hypothetical protein QGH20_04715 [Candidatus Latescibacteria bacterium]|jgi:hypothetical protein|nr:hypothetical protein [Candidatus Latescibacterota bacterium]
MGVSPLPSDHDLKKILLMTRTCQGERPEKLMKGSLCLAKPIPPNVVIANVELKRIVTHPLDPALNLAKVTLDGDADPAYG